LLERDAGLALLQAGAAVAWLLRTAWLCPLPDDWPAVAQAAGLGCVDVA
jgi:hypothetical protein